MLPKHLLRPPYLHQVSSNPKAVHPVSVSEELWTLAFGSDTDTVSVKLQYQYSQNIQFKYIFDIHLLTALGEIEREYIKNRERMIY